MKHLICSIYRSTKKDECYLYVDKARGLACLPEALLELFGAPQEVMTMLLRPEKPLARADIHKVMEALKGQGYYLQLPPPVDSEMQRIHQLNDKITR